MLPMIEKEMLRHKWAKEKEILDYYALSQVTPGIIAVNVSTFIGYKIRGFWGAVCTMTGVILPSLIIIGGIATGLSAVWNLEWVKNAFRGIQLMIPALIAPIVFRMIQKGSKTALSICVMIGAFVLRQFGVSPIFILCLAAVVTLFCFKREKKKK